jgi:hypothetical protein
MSEQDEREEAIEDALPNPNPEGQDDGVDNAAAVDPIDLARHYEQEDVDVGALVRFAAAILVGAVIAGVALWFAVRVWMGQPLPAQIQIAPAAVTPPVAPGPGLDAMPEANLQRVLERDRERLETYGWVDRDAGVVRIPVEEAMRLLVERGVPAREGDAPSFGLEPAFRLDSSGGTTVVGQGAADE